jgi:hypothetical protein
MFANESCARAVGFGELDSVALFYNEYYWFKRFVLIQEATNGPDAGLEQQAFQLMETAPGKVNWTILEAIEARLKALS